jgi:hypothetical protein
MRQLAIGVTVLAVGTVLLAAGGAGLPYLACWFAVVLPGVPLGVRLFGRSVLGVAAGAAGAYVLTALAFWAVIAAHAASPAAFLAAWIIVAALLLAAWRLINAPVLPATTAWTGRDSAGLLAVLLLVPLLMGLPYRHVGATDEVGRRYYRAYFTADFVWHTALTSELRRFEMPPHNPYLAKEDLHYYWTYFLVPAVITRLGPDALQDVETALKVCAVGTAMLLVASMYALAAAAVRRRTAAVAGVWLVTLAASAEGSAVIVSLLLHERPLNFLRFVNIDAVTAWWYKGLRIDGVHRTMLYTPQHGLSSALGLLALVIASAAGVGASARAILAAGVLLALAATLNPFLGGAFCAVYGIAILLDGAARRSPIRDVLRHAIAAVPPVAAVAWGVMNAMGEGAGSALTLGWTGDARHAPILTLLLSLGPVLLPALAGWLPDRRLSAQPARTAAGGLLVGLFLLYGVTLTDKSWVGFRAGQILLAILMVPLARLFDRVLDRSRVTAAGLTACILTAGLATTAVDVYNASDITNLAMGPGFPWTITLSPSQQGGLAWIRRATRPDAIVQAEPIVRGRAQWSLIPSFAQRRMAAGLPISLLATPEYTERSRLARAILTSGSAAEAHQTARRLGIDYLWIDADDRRVYAPGIAVLDSAPGLFAPVFRQDDVTVYEVRR